MNEFLSGAGEVKLGKGVELSKFTNLCGCEVGMKPKSARLSKSRKNAEMGNRCKISHHTFYLRASPAKCAP
jgi:hypothetical protein